jgi:hypothetical protein
MGLCTTVCYGIIWRCYVERSTRTYIRASDMYDHLDPEDEIYLATQCAVTAVSEIIEQWEYIDAYIANGMGELNPNLKYWYEVKQELEKL